MIRETSHQARHYLIPPWIIQNCFFCKRRARQGSYALLRFPGATKRLIGGLFLARRACVAPGACPLRVRWARAIVARPSSGDASRYYRFTVIVHSQRTFQKLSLFLLTNGQLYGTMVSRQVARHTVGTVQGRRAFVGRARFAPYSRPPLRR